MGVGSTLTHHVIPSLAYVEWAWATQNCELAQEHAERAVSIGNGSHSPSVEVYSGWAKGLAHVTMGRNSEAIEQFSSSLDFARRRKAGLRTISPFGGPRQCPPLREGG